MIDPSAAYPAQVSGADPTGYPFGKAQNDTVAGDGTGTPLEAAWVNDVFGFFASLADAASLIPSGTPDKVGASQLLTAVKWVSAHVDQDAEFSAKLTLAGLFRANGLAEFHDQAAFFDQLAAVGFVTAAGGLGVAGSFTSNAPASFLQGATFSSLVTFNGATTTFTKELLLSGTAIFTENKVTAPDADHTYNVGEFTLLVIPSSVTAIRTYQFNDGTREGQVLKVLNCSLFTHVIHDSGGGVPSLAASITTAAVGRAKMTTLVWTFAGAYTGWVATD